jgi:hypothetical protein
MPDRFPGYDVLAKRHTQSWNEQTRRVIDRRLAVPAEPRFLTPAEYATLQALAACIVPQPPNRPPIPVWALIDEKLHAGREDGFRAAGMPKQGEAWRIGLGALAAEAEAAHGKPFQSLDRSDQEGLIRHMEKGALAHAAWRGMSPVLFFQQRLLHDILLAYYAHPTAWSEIGFGGPASPRGYVRMDFNRRDPWEATEAKPGEEDQARKENARVR